MRYDTEMKKIGMSVKDFYENCLFNFTINVDGEKNKNVARKLCRWKNVNNIVNHVK
jgi:hypothetical protein